MTFLDVLVLDAFIEANMTALYFLQIVQQVLKVLLTIETSLSGFHKSRVIDLKVKNEKVSLEL